MAKRRTKRRRKRRSQADILVSTIEKMPAKKAVSINDLAKRSRSTWRTTKKNLDVLVKAKVVERVREKGSKRYKYKRKG